MTSGNDSTSREWGSPVPNGASVGREGSQMDAASDGGVHRGASGAGDGSALSSHVALIGFMGAGKSTVARRLARMYRKVSFDTDIGIARMVGKSIPDIFADEGEQAFREYECQYLRYLKGMEPGIVSCGGGIVTYEASRKALRELGFVVFLDVDVDEVYKRISSTDSRPMLTGDRQKTVELYESRLPLYRECADLVMDTNGKSPGNVARELGRALVRRGVMG